MAELEEVIDTNVLISARARPSDRVEPACALESLEYLRRVEKVGRVHLDSSGLIMAEYRRYFDYSGQPTAADRFVQWLHENQANANRVRQSDIHPHVERGFVEFPDMAELETFDPSDRKFVATSMACDDSPAIAHSADRGWLVHADALEEAGVPTRCLCATTRSQP